jgi:hypothetical protein
MAGKQYKRNVTGYRYNAKNGRVKKGEENEKMENKKEFDVDYSANAGDSDAFIGLRRERTVRRGRRKRGI